MGVIQSIPRRLVSESQNSPAQELTAEKLRELLHYDPETGVFTRKVSTSNNVKTGDIAGRLVSDGYIRVKVRNIDYYAHRLAWFYVYGTWPKDQIDHINRDRADNRITNLRDVSCEQNHQNRSKSSNNMSGYPGVYWNKRRGKWRAHIKHSQNNVHLGYFETIEEAVAARKAGELKYWGQCRAD